MTRPRRGRASVVVVALGVAVTSMGALGLWGAVATLPGCAPGELPALSSTGGRVSPVVGVGGQGGTSAASGTTGNAGGGRPSQVEKGGNGSVASGGATLSGGGAGLGGDGRADTGGGGSRGGAGSGAGGSLSGNGGRAGTATGGAADPKDPLNMRVSCSSGKRSSGGLNENMAPGRPCLDCHGGFALAGTVFPTGHETNDCQGLNDQSVTVVITDVHGDSVSLPTNSVGNFAAAGYLEPPFTAKVVRGAKERRMLTPQTDTNCNNCHTVDGAQGAPGRIVAPF